MFSIVHQIGSTACLLEPAKFRGAPPLCCGRPRDRSLIGLNDARDDFQRVADGRTRRIPEDATEEIGYLLGMSASTPKYIP